MGGKTTTSSNAEPWREMQPYLKRGMKQGEKLFNQGGFAADPWGGDRVADFSGASNRGQQRIMREASGPQRLQNQAEKSLVGMMSGNMADLEGVKNNALGAAIPEAVSMFSGSGLTDSSAAMDTVGRAATEAISPYYFDAYNQAQNRSLNAIGMAPAIQEAGYLPGEMMQRVGAMRDMKKQQEIDARMGRYYERQGQDAANLQGWFNTLNPVATMGGNSQSTTQESPGIGDILGTGLQLMGLFGFSDRRMKENIVKVGERKGRTVYAYNYLWSPTIEFGVMADENPDMISHTVGGYAVVDYARM